MNDTQLEKEKFTVEDGYKVINQTELNYWTDQMIDLIKNESAILKGKTENIFIGGFSQGCMLSIATFLKMKD